MKHLSKTEYVVLAVNSLGLAAYLLWLVLGRRQMFYHPDGVLILLPCLPFFFVYLLLFRREGGGKE